MSNLEDVTRTDYIGNTDTSVLLARLDESGEYVYVNGDYVRRISPDFVVKKRTFIALRGDEIVEFEIVNTIDGVEITGEERILSDEELSKRISSLRIGDPPMEMWWDFLRNYDDWSFVQFVRKHRPHLI